MGQTGEQRAQAFLKKLGYRILDCNVTFGHLELDIVAQAPRAQQIVFVEVKTRQTRDFETPLASINYRKRQAWQRAAVKYLQIRQLRTSFRLDLIMVYPDQIQHFPDITSSL